MNSFFAAFSKFEKIILLIIVSIYFNNLFIDIMKIDAAQYASISLEMLKSHSYLQVTDLQMDYLDKPPLLFWISSLSLGIFGVCNFAYKLGAFLMLLLSLIAIFRFSKLYYSTQIGKNAVLIFGTCQAFFLMTNDVRTDGLLTSSVITAVWLLSEYSFQNKIKYLLGAALFTSFAMMAKGPIGIIAVLMPIGLQLLYQKKWKQIFSPSWLLFLVVVGILLLPMSYGLYQQFDLHPEKVINGKQNQSGLYFYYWLQSFGRITGENVWDNGLPWHFFIGSISWDFFPWILVLYAGLFLQIKRLVKRKNQKLPEIITLSGFVLLFAMLSMSKYKLPHYIFVTLPFASIMSSIYLDTLNNKQWKNWYKVYFAFGCMVCLLLIIYQVFFFTEINYITLYLILVQAFFLIKMNKFPTEGITKLIGYIIVLNLFLSFVFYPKLLTFQADSMAAKWFYDNQNNQKVYQQKQKVYLIDEASNCFNFYTQNPFQKVIHTTDLDTIKNTFWIYCKEDKIATLPKNFKILEQKKFEDYPITQLKLPFLLQEKRATMLQYKYLLQLKKE